jgi:hypothetical protein
VEIKRNYAFVEYRELEDAIAAQKRCHGTVFEGRTITVEFVESSRLGRQDRCAPRVCGRPRLQHAVVRSCVAPTIFRRAAMTPHSLCCITRAAQGPLAVARHGRPPPLAVALWPGQVAASRRAGWLLAAPPHQPQPATPRPLALARLQQGPRAPQRQPARQVATRPQPLLIDRQRVACGRDDWRTWSVQCVACGRGCDGKQQCAVTT